MVFAVRLNKILPVKQYRRQNSKLVAKPLYMGVYDISKSQYMAVQERYFKIGKGIE